MKIRDGGKEHTERDPYCSACDVLDGERHPQICGVDLCTGLRHAEKFGIDREGAEFAYRCDKCGETADQLRSCALAFGIRRVL